MKMKKFLSMLLALLLMASILVGCGKQEEPATVDQSQIQIDESAAEQSSEEEAKLDPEAVLLQHTIAYFDNLPSNNNMIAAKDALDLIENNPDAIFVVDMRAKEDYEKGHLPGAVNIPLGEMGKNLDRLPNNKQIILVCYSGQTTGLTVSALNLLGFNAISFQGGMNFGWASLELSEDTLETEANPLPEPKAPNLDEEEQILWDAVVAFFNEAKSNIESAEKAYETIESNPDAVYILDIRAKDDFEKGHIEGSENIPFREMGKNIDKLPKNRPIYVMCYSGQTAAQTQSLLRINGYNAYSIGRGMAGWNGAELPVVTN